MIPLKNKQQGSALITLLGGAIILISVLVLLVKLAGSGYTSTVAETTDSATETRIMPSGKLKMGDGTEPGQRTGKQVFDKICVQCHAADSNIAYAPKITKNAEWSARIAKGFDTLVKNAVEGFQGQGLMPAKGGAVDLTNDEVARAVAYMANQSGANFTEPAVGAAKADNNNTNEANNSTADNATAATPQTDASGSSSGDSAQAKAHFEQACAVCHAATSAIPFAPKLTKNDEWADRIKQGKDTLFKHAIEGYTNPKGGVMPPKGGSSLSDEEVKAVVVYMANESGAKF